jgi:hypothetical protein
MDNQNPYGGGGAGMPGGGYTSPQPGMGAPTGTLDVGDVLATTFRTLGAAAGPIAGCSLAAAVPVVVLYFGISVIVYAVFNQFMGPDAAAQLSTDPRRLWGFLGVMYGSYFVVFLAILAVQSVGQGGIMYVVAEQMSGRRPAVGPALRVGLSRAFWVFLVHLILSFGVAIGAAFCCVPGVIVFVFFCIASCVSVVERAGPLTSLQRALQLTEGQRLPIFLIYLVVVIGWFVCSVCIVGPVQMIITFGGLAASGGGLGTMPSPFSIGALLNHVIALPVLAFEIAVFSALGAVIYARLRGLRDGVDAQALASVFS